MAKRSAKSRLEECTERIHKVLNDPSVQHVFGATGLKAHGKPRRIVWVRTQSPIEAPRQAGGRLQGAREDERPQNRAFRVRLCRVRVQTVDAHVYGEDDGAADQIVDSLLAAVETEVPQVEYVFEDWPMETLANANLTHFPKVVIRMRIRLAVADEIAPLHAAEFEHECGLLDAEGNLKS